jgi:hypothetical protein
MGVRVDDRRDRLVGELADLVEDRLAPPRILGVDDNHARRGHEDSGIAAARWILEDPQIVPELLGLEHLRRRLSGGRLLIRRKRHRQ